MKPLSVIGFYVFAALTTNLKSRTASSKQSPGLTPMLGITWIYRFLVTGLFEVCKYTCLEVILSPFKNY